MKNYEFEVTFSVGGSKFYYTSSPIKAVILAMADRIRDGKDCRVEKVTDENGKEFESVVDLLKLN